MPNGENHNLFVFIVIKNDICPMSRLDHPFAKFGWKLLDETAHIRMFGKRFDTLANRLHRVTGCFAAFGKEKLMQSGYVLK